MSRIKASGGVSPARRAAFDILLRVAEEDSYASALIAALPERELSREDRALAQELVLGTLRWQAALDYFIERYSGRKIDKLDIGLVLALRLGLYQVRFLSRIPAPAAVNESVKLVKRARLSSAAGLANAVLRRAAQHPNDLPGEAISDPLDRASVELSHPPWMFERWANDMGEAGMRELALANNQAPEIAFRVNSLRSGVDEAITLLETEGIIASPSKIFPGAFIVEQGSGLAGARAVRDGMIYIQDAASQMVSLLLEPKPGQRILDLCAAPGSKTTHIAALTDNQAWIVACDLHRKRLAALRKSAERLGAANLDLLALDAAVSLPFVESAAKFDRVLVDAPCSGTGTLRQNPEIRWRLTAGDIDRLASMQLAMLKNAAEVVAPGGRLVYSTCSMEGEEGEGVVQEFLTSDSGSGFKAVLPDRFKSLITSDGFVRTYPHVHRADGFFAAVLERTAQPE